MTFIFPALLFVIFIACVASLYTEGMWSNAIRLINVVTAALLATNFFEPTADWLEGLGSWFASLTYVWDFLALWGLFGIFMIVLRLATDFLSRVKVRFLKIADQIGSGLLACWIGWVMVCFTTMTLHTAPLAKYFLFEGFQPEQRMFLRLAPDRQWLGFMQKMSRGTFSRAATTAELNRRKYGVRPEDDEQEQKLCVFDRNAQFMPKYATRRSEVQTNILTTKNIRVRRK